MRKINCNTIRRELDELDLNENCSAPASLHLRECAECLEFYQSRTKLRRLVGSLEMVGAPADFDFRLRARLANQKARAGYGAFAGWSLGVRASVMAGLILVIGTLVLVNHRRNPPSNVLVGEQKTATTEPAPQIETKTAVATAAKTKVPVTVPSGHENMKVSAGNNFVAKFRAKRAIVAKDFSSLSASRVRREESSTSTSVPTVFPIDTSYQSLRVSLDDGTGTWRTISLPTVSFGSQRILAKGSLSNQPAPKGIW